MVVIKDLFADTHVLRVRRLAQSFTDDWVCWQLQDALLKFVILVDFLLNLLDLVVNDCDIGFGRHREIRLQRLRRLNIRGRLGVRNDSRMDERLCRILAHPLKLSIDPLHLSIFSLFGIKVVQIEMRGLAQKLSQLELIVDYQAYVADVLLAEMVIGFVASTVFLRDFRIGVTLERIMMGITFRGWFGLIFAMISNCLKLLLLKFLRLEHVVHNVRHIAVLIQMHPVLCSELLVGLNLNVQKSLGAISSALAGQSRTSTAVVFVNLEFLLGRLLWS